MRKSNLVLVTALALSASMVCGTLSDAKCNVSIGLEADGRIVIPAKKKLVNVYEAPDKESKVLAHFEDGTYLSVLGVSGKWLRVTNEDGSVKGYVKDTSVRTNKQIKKDIKKSPSDYNLMASFDKTTGGYAGRDDSSKFQTFNYSSELELKDDAVVYKTDKVQEHIKGEFTIKKYVRIVGDGVRLRSRADTGEKSRILTLADKGYEYRLVGESGDFYEVACDWGSAFIMRDYCDVFEKKIPKSNISSVNFPDKSYKIVGEGNMLEFKSGKDTYYVKDSEVRRSDEVSLDSAARVVVSRGTKYDVMKYGFGDNDIKIVGYNNLGMPEPVWVNTDNVHLDAWFDDVKPLVGDKDIEDEDEEVSRNKEDASDADKVFRPDKTDSSRYSYDWDNSSTPLRNKVIRYALKWLGNPYVYGGMSLTDGIDCSAFCMRVLQYYGINCGRSTAIQVSENAGRTIKMKDIQPGDLIYYTHDGVTPYHVVMYLGGDKCVNASCRKLGVCISTVNKGKILKVKNYID